MKKIYLTLIILTGITLATNAQSDKSFISFWGIPFGSSEKYIKKTILLKSKGFLIEKKQDGNGNFYRLWYSNIEFAKKQSDIFFELQDNKFVCAVVLFNNKDCNIEKLKELFNDIRYDLDKKYFPGETLWNSDCEWKFQDKSSILLSITNNRSVILRYTYKTYYDWINKQIEINDKENKSDY